MPQRDSRHGRLRAHMQHIVAQFIKDFVNNRVFLQVVRLLEIGLVLDYQGFPGFREALGPSIIEWDRDPGEIAQRADEISQGMDPNATLSA